MTETVNKNETIETNESNQTNETNKSNETYVESINVAKKPSKKGKKKKKDKKKGKKKKKEKKKVKLSDLMDDDNKEKKNANNVNNGNKLMIRKMGQRKSIIGMLRQGVIMDEKKDLEPIEQLTAELNIKCVVRVRPVNKREKEVEHRLMFRNEFDMDDKDYEQFLEKRQELIDDTDKDIKTLTVDQICQWLEDINLSMYVKRFRRRKVNGEWINSFPRFNEKKPLEFDENSIIAFTKGNKSKKYEMDHVLKPNIKQNQTFELLGRPIVDNILKGYNCTIFAFGQV